MPTPRKYESTADKQKAYRERMKEARLQELHQKGLPGVPAIPTMPGTARWRALESQAFAALSTVCDEMQEYFDGRTVVWQESERGEEFSARLDSIRDVLENLEELAE
jgi:hypothetical protein